MVVAVPSAPFHLHSTQRVYFLLTRQPAEGQGAKKQRHPQGDAAISQGHDRGGAQGDVQRAQAQGQRAFHKTDASRGGRNDQEEVTDAEAGDQRAHGEVHVEGPQNQAQDQNQQGFTG